MVNSPWMEISSRMENIKVLTLCLSLIKSGALHLWEVICLGWPVTWRSGWAAVFELSVSETLEEFLKFSWIWWTFWFSNFEYDWGFYSLLILACSLPGKVMGTMLSWTVCSFPRGSHEEGAPGYLCLSITKLGYLFYFFFLTLRRSFLSIGLSKNL